MMPSEDPRAVAIMARIEALRQELAKIGYDSAAYVLERSPEFDAGQGRFGRIAGGARTARLVMVLASELGTLLESVCPDMDREAFEVLAWLTELGRRCNVDGNRPFQFQMPPPPWIAMGEATPIGLNDLRGHVYPN